MRLVRVTEADGRVLVLAVDDEAVARMRAAVAACGDCEHVTVGCECTVVAVGERGTVRRG